MRGSHVNSLEYRLWVYANRVCFGLLGITRSWRRSAVWYMEVSHRGLNCYVVRNVFLDYIWRVRMCVVGEEYASVQGCRNKFICGSRNPLNSVICYFLVHRRCQHVLFCSLSVKWTRKVTKGKWRHILGVRNMESSGSLEIAYPMGYENHTPPLHPKTSCLPLRPSWGSQPTVLKTLHCFGF